MSSRSYRSLVLRGASPPRVAAEQDRIERLRQVMRGMLPMLSHYQMTGIQEFPDCYGTVWNIHDVLRLYRLSQQVLTKKQAEAIHLGLVCGMRESTVAEQMGTPSNPVMMYATDGLRILDAQMDLGWAA